MMFQFAMLAAGFFLGSVATGNYETAFYLTVGAAAVRLSDWLGRG